MKGDIRVFLFIFTFCLLPVRLNAAQELPFPEPATTVSMDFQDASLKDILKIFSIQSGLNFIASEAVQDRKITLYLDKVPIKEVMDKLFLANNLSYELDSRANIFIVKDWGVPQIETVTRVFALKHATVSSSSFKEEMARSRVQSGSTSAVSSSSYGSSASAGITSSGSGQGKWKSEESAGITEAVKKLLSPNGIVIEDYRTNSLIVTDIPNRIPTIASTVALLDIPVTQVLIEVEMLDVSKDTVDKLGLEFGQSPLTMAFTGAKLATPFPFPATTYRNRSFSKTLTPGSFDFSSTTAYSAVFDFLKTQTDTKYLARPKLLTLNNETAEISITKDEVVGKKETTVTPTTGGSTATVEFIRSTDLALTREGTGIYLRVTPQVNPETNEITMVINPKSSVTSQSTLSGASTQADAEVRSTKSIVKVKDGETVMLGGIIHTDKKVVVKRLPFLSDIPFLGALFKHKNQSKDIERELIVFITPRIVKDKGAEFAKMEKAPLPKSARREQGESAASSHRSAIINASLNTIEKAKK